ncbi:MAG TPA: Gfo/Idh/MocA family oxidoreductase [Arsenicitalea sp.]|nr:Gfo/Idh/MocA family oxidoreductase [Arsenicitalea sp.]
MLTWGLVGAGNFAHTIARAVKESSGSRLLAVNGRGEARTTAFQREHDIPRLYLNLDEMLSDPEIDIVHVAAPTVTHRDVCIRAANAGKHIVSEKSLAMDMDEARDLLAAVERNGVFFVEGLMYLSHPLMARYSEIIRSGILGTIKSVVALYAAPSGGANPSSGGTILDLACYPASLLQLTLQTAFGAGAFGDRRATAATGFASKANGNILETALSVRFGCGVLASLQSVGTVGFSTVFKVSGERGALEFETNPWLPVAGANVMRLRLYDRPTEEIVVQADYDAYYHQVVLAEQQISAKQKVAVRPSPTPSDSLEILSLLTEWRTLAKASAEHSL